ncbi:MAG: ATP phosphoribosyltransferase regulatory subunit [Hyphomicrobiales bacterium]
MKTEALTTLFESAGCTGIEPSVLQPADPFLNAAGEAFRKSLFVTQGAKGETLCLRPEFTIPVCLEHKGAAARYHYSGSVFRQATEGRDDKPQEFEQAGVEALGEADFAKADADMVRLALDAVRALVASDGDIKPVVQMGDPAFFNALVTPVGLPEIWRERLTRAFGDADLVEAMLKRMVSAPVVASNDFKTDDSAALTEKVSAMMQAHGMMGAGGRTADEIAQRFLKKRNEQVSVSTTVTEICRRFLALECASDKVGDTMTRFGEENGIDFAAAIAGYDARAKGLQGLDAEITFSASFGRRLDYYTGFVFEIYDANNRAKGPLAGGGRYDGLTEMLGDKAMPAVGFSLWLERCREGGAS